MTLAAGTRHRGFRARVTPALVRHMHLGEHVKTNVDALVGGKAVVVATVDAQSGQVKINGVRTRIIRMSPSTAPSSPATGASWVLSGWPR